MRLIQLILASSYAVASETWPRDDAVAPFVAWLSTFGVDFSQIEIRPSGLSGYGVFATAPLKRGTIIASLPSSLSIDCRTVTSHGVIGVLVADVYDRRHELQPHLSAVLEPDLKKRKIALSMFMHHEYFYNRARSPWRPYLEMLPSPAEAVSLQLLWSPAEEALAAEFELGMFGDSRANSTGSASFEAVAALHRAALWDRLPHIYGDTADPAVLQRLTQVRMIASMPVSRSSATASPAPPPRRSCAGPWRWSTAGRSQGLRAAACCRSWTWRITTAGRALS